MVRQIFAVGGVICGYIIAVKYFEHLLGYLPDMDLGIKKIISFSGIFLICVISFSIVGWFLNKLFKFVGLGWVNRLCGGILGFLKGLLIILIMVVILIVSLPTESNILKDSVTLPYLTSVVKIIDGVIPQNIKNSYEKKIEEMKSYFLRKQLGDKVDL